MKKLTNKILIAMLSAIGGLSNIVNAQNLKPFEAENKTWGFKDENGKEVISPKYQSTRRFSEEFAAVTLKNKSGYIDKTGKEVIPFNYDQAFEFSEGLAAVNVGGKANDNGDFIGGKWGYIDKTGKEVIPFKYDFAEYDNSYYSNGLAAVRLIDKWGYIDKTGKEVIPFKYAAAERFSEELAAVKLNGKYGFIDKMGKVAVPFNYANAYYFLKDGRAKVNIGGKFDEYGDFEGGKWIFIDKTGKEVK